MSSLLDVGNFTATINVASQTYTEEHKSNVTLNIDLACSESDGLVLTSYIIAHGSIEGLAGDDRVDNLCLAIKHKGSRTTEAAPEYLDSFDDLVNSDLANAVQKQEDSNHEDGQTVVGVKLMPLLDSNRCTLNAANQLQFQLRGEDALLFGNSYSIYIVAKTDSRHTTAPDTPFLLNATGATADQKAKYDFMSYNDADWKAAIKNQIENVDTSTLATNSSIAADTATTGWDALKKNVKDNDWGTGDKVLAYMNALRTEIADQSDTAKKSNLKKLLPKKILKHSFVRRRSKPTPDVDVITILTDGEKAGVNGSEGFTSASNRAVLSINPFYDEAPAYEKAYITSVSVNLKGTDVLYPKQDLTNTVNEGTANNGVTFKNQGKYAIKTDSHEVYHTGALEIVSGDGNTKHLEGEKGTKTIGVKSFLTAAEQKVDQSKFDPLGFGLPVTSKVFEFVQGAAFNEMQEFTFDTDKVAKIKDEPNDSRRQNLRQYMVPNDRTDSFTGADMIANGSIRVLCASAGAPNFYETPANGAIPFALKDHVEIKVHVKANHEDGGLHEKMNTAKKIKCRSGNTNPAGTIIPFDRATWKTAYPALPATQPTSMAGKCKFRIQANMPNHSNVESVASSINHHMRIYVKQWDHANDSDAMKIGGFNESGAPKNFIAQYISTSDGSNTGVSGSLVAHTSSPTNTGLFKEDDIPLDKTMDEFLVSKGFKYNKKVTATDLADKVENLYNGVIVDLLNSTVGGEFASINEIHESRPVVVLLVPECLKDTAADTLAHPEHKDGEMPVKTSQLGKPLIFFPRKLPDPPIISYDKTHARRMPAEEGDRGDQFIIEIKPQDVNGPANKDSNNDWQGSGYQSAHISWERINDSGTVVAWKTGEVTVGSGDLDYQKNFPTNNELMDYERRQNNPADVPTYDLMNLPSFREDFNGTDNKGHIYKIRVTLHPDFENTDTELYDESKLTISNRLDTSTLGEKFPLKAATLSNGLKIRARDSLANTATRINNYVNLFQLRANTAAKQIVSGNLNQLGGAEGISQKVEVAVQSSEDNKALAASNNKAHRKAYLKIDDIHGHSSLETLEGETFTVEVTIKQNNLTNIDLTNTELSSNFPTKSTKASLAVAAIKTNPLDVVPVEIAHGKYHSITSVHVAIADKNGDGTTFQQIINAADTDVVLQNKDKNDSALDYYGDSSRGDVTMPVNVPTHYRRLYSRRDIRGGNDYWSDPDLIDDLRIQAGTIDETDATNGMPKVLAIVNDAVVVDQNSNPTFIPTTLCNNTPHNNHNIAAHVLGFENITITLETPEKQDAFENETPLTKDTRAPYLPRYIVKVKAPFEDDYYIAYDSHGTDGGINQDNLHVTSGGSAPSIKTYAVEYVPTNVELTPFGTNKGPLLGGAVKFDHNNNKLVEDDEDTADFQTYLGERLALPDVDPDDADTSQFHDESLLGEDDGEKHQTTIKYGDSTTTQDVLLGTTSTTAQPLYGGDDTINFAQHYSDLLAMIYNRNSGNKSSANHAFNTGNLFTTLQEGQITAARSTGKWLEFGKDIENPRGVIRTKAPTANGDPTKSFTLKRAAFGDDFNNTISLTVGGATLNKNTSQSWDDLLTSSDFYSEDLYYAWTRGGSRFESYVWCDFTLTFTYSSDDPRSIVLASGALASDIKGTEREVKVGFWNRSNQVPAPTPAAVHDGIVSAFVAFASPGVTVTCTANINFALGVDGDRTFPLSAIDSAITFSFNGLYDTGGKDSLIKTMDVIVEGPPGDNYGVDFDIDSVIGKASAADFTPDTYTSFIAADLLTAYGKTGINVEARYEIERYNWTSSIWQTFNKAPDENDMSTSTVTMGCVPSIEELNHWINESIQLNGGTLHLDDDDATASVRGIAPGVSLANALRPGDLIRIKSRLVISKVNSTLATVALDSNSLNTVITGAPISLFANAFATVIKDAPGQTPESQNVTATNYRQNSAAFRLLQPITALRDIDLESNSSQMNVVLKYFNGAGSRVEAEAIGIYVDEVASTLEHNASLEGNVSLQYFSSSAFGSVTTGTNGLLTGPIEGRYGVSVTDQHTTNAGNGDAPAGQDAYTNWTSLLEITSVDLKQTNKKLVMLLIFTQSTEHTTNVMTEHPSQQKKILVLTGDDFDNSNDYAFDSNNWWSGTQSLIIG